MERMEMQLDDITEERLLDILPHGSGIDCDWTFDRCQNGTIRCRNSYHVMDEHGSYCGYYDFTVHIFAHKSDERRELIGLCAGQVQIVHRKGDIDFRITSRMRERGNTYGLRDYLNESIGYALESILTSRHEVVSNTQQNER